MPEWNAADPETVQEIVREADQYISGQVTLATSADQRAATLAGIYTAAATAIAVALIAAISTGGANLALIAGGGAAVLMFLVGAWMCISTALPIEFWIPGNAPKNWYADVENNRPLIDALGEALAHTQKHIDQNNATLKRNGRRFRRGALIGMAAPLLGAAIWLLTSLSVAGRC